jgi:hypothetical protein
MGRRRSDRRATLALTHPDAEHPMATTRDQFRSSYGAHTARERALERSRARRDALDAAHEVPRVGGQPAAASDSPVP